MTARIDTLLAASGLPRLDAQLLLAHVLGVRRETLVAWPANQVGRDRARRFEQLAARRRAGEPLAYLTGEREFYGRSFRVSPAVLVPRPETELLVDLALEALRPLRAPRVLDLGTGSGCIAITLALQRPDAQVAAVDRAADALEVAGTNARALGAHVEWANSDWYAAVDGCFDVIVANPPYVAAGDPHLDDLRHEPPAALSDDGDGLACLRVIALGARPRLTPGGWLLVEHGHDQGEAVRALFSAAGLAAVQTLRDAAGIDRVCRGRRAD
jgi:release factor glutamine methyltransferase